LNAVFRFCVVCVGYAPTDLQTYVKYEFPFPVSMASDEVTILYKYLVLEFTLPDSFHFTWL